MKLTTCRDCKHFRSVGGSIIPWYRQRCAAVLRNALFDCYEGKFSSGELSYCRDINTDGHCRWFEEIEG